MNRRRLYTIVAGALAHAFVIATLIVLWQDNPRSNQVSTSAALVPRSTAADGSVGSVVVGGITLVRPATTTEPPTTTTPEPPTTTGPA
jgi:hypothetical protein